MRSINDIMDKVAAAIRSEYISLDTRYSENVDKIKKTFQSMMIDIANNINNNTSRFDRNRFLCRAGHPNWETGFYKTIK